MVSVFYMLNMAVGIPKIPIPT